MATSLEALKKLTAERAKIFSFFSRIFRKEVDVEFLETLKRSLKAVSIDNSEMGHGYDRLRHFLQEMKMTKESIEDLSADYAALFLGIGRHPAHPYESVYRSEEKIIMQEPRNEVLKRYYEEGVRKVKWFKEPDDHVAVELEFIVYLCLKTLEALDKDDRAEVLRLLQTQQDFLREHLESWLPEFCGDIIKGSAKYDFYAIVGEMTAKYINLDKHTLNQTISELNQ